MLAARGGRERDARAGDGGAGDRGAGDRGAVTAEIAVALPTIVVVLAACIGGVGVTTTLLAASDAAADAARLIARGDGPGAASAHVRAVLPGATLRTDRRDTIVCATVDATPRVLGIGMPVSARSCSLAAGVD